MAESITLQTSDNNVQQSDVLGRLSFAASNESSGSDARLIGASIYAIAESDFTEISNATSLIFATAASENAQESMRINSNGNVGIGTNSPAAKLHIVGSGIFSNGINIANQTASTITSFDSNKNLVSLSTSTYPSLTELSYVKGVTSSIQTQLNNAINSKTLCTFTASDNQPPATDYATLDTRNSILVLDFDDGAINESANFIGFFPNNTTLNANSGIYVRITWMATTATTGTCRWGARFGDLISSDLDSDNWATARAANTSLLGSSAGTPQTTSILCSGTSIDFFGTSIALTPFRLQVYRDSSDTIQDTMVGDAELLCVEVRNNI